jgi:RNA polymerase sigma-70 factor (ECF subfamily)
MNTYSTYDDDTLIHLLKQGAEGAFTEIYHRYWDRLVDAGYYYTKDKQAVEEIVHDVLLRLWQKREVYQIQSLTDYLGTAVKFGIFKAIQKAQRRKKLLETQPAASLISLEEEQRIEARFTAAWLNGIVEALPEKSRLIFKYSREQDMSVAEIARKMDMQPRAVEYHISKVLKILRGYLRKPTGEVPLLPVIALMKVLHDLLR